MFVRGYIEKVGMEGNVGDMMGEFPQFSGFLYDKIKYNLKKVRCNKER